MAASVFYPGLCSHIQVVQLVDCVRKCARPMSRCWWSWKVTKITRLLSDVNAISRQHFLRTVDTCGMTKGDVGQQGAVGRTRTDPPAAETQREWRMLTGTVLQQKCKQRFPPPQLPKGHSEHVFSVECLKMGL